METKIKIEITKDHHSDNSYRNYIDNLNYVVSEIDCFCEITNNNYINIIEQEKRYNSNKDDYKNYFIVEAIGYSQGDWQRYKVYYNKDSNNIEQKNNIKDLKKLLSQSFTHKNDYSVTKKEIITIKNKEYETIIDCTGFCIDHIEFPDEKDIITEYNSIYGIDYDEYQVNID